MSHLIKIEVDPDLLKEGLLIPDIPDHTVLALYFWLKSEQFEAKTLEHERKMLLAVSVAIGVAYLGIFNICVPVVLFAEGVRQLGLYRKFNALWHKSSAEYSIHECLLKS